MVEAQAAARIDRLDQTKDIVIVRYVVEDLIEQVRDENKIYLPAISKLTICHKESKSPAKEQNPPCRAFCFANVHGSGR